MIVYRNASAEDAANIFEALHVIINELDIYNEGAKSAERLQYTLQYIIGVIEVSQTSTVAYENDVLVGFSLCDEDGGVVWISWLVVLPQWQRQGIGKEILKKTEDYARQHHFHKVWCDTRTINLPSMTMLQSCNWARVAELRNHWHNQDYYLWEHML